MIKEKRLNSQRQLLSKIQNDSWKKGKHLSDLFQITGYLGYGGMGTVYRVRLCLPDPEIYAVKTLHAEKFQDENLKKEFIEELRTWIDLPDHINLTACRFYKTIENRLAIFSELIDGGSLQTWIESGRIRSSEQALDIAIQIALGLQAAHDHGVIHQDIKPGNILMSRSGIPKITDFGLARARFMSTGDSTLGSAPDFHLVSSRGMTLAYCSPEQAAGDRVSFSSDLWSWAVTLMQMFTGRVSWILGTTAPLILSNYLNNRPSKPRIPIRESLAKFLRQCFETDPKHRFSSMIEAARSLALIYEETTSKHYFGLDQMGSSGDSRTTPDRNIQNQSLKAMGWLQKSCRLAVRRIPSRFRSEPLTNNPRSRLLLEIEMMLEAEKILKDQICKGQFDLKNQLAELYRELAEMYRQALNYEAAILTLKKSSSTYRQMWRTGRKISHLNGIAYSELKIIQLKQHMGLMEEALDLNHASIETIKSLSDDEIDDDTRGYLSKLYLSLGIIHFCMNRFDSSIVAFGNSRDLFEQLVFNKSQDVLRDPLARVYQNLAAALNSIGQFDDAQVFLDRSIRLRKQVLAESFDEDIHCDLAHTVMNYAITLHFQKRYHEALPYYDDAIAMIQGAADRQGFSKYGSDLALVLSNKAATMLLLNEWRGALELIDRSNTAINNQIRQFGRTDLAEALAIGYYNRAQALSGLRNPQMAIESLDRCIEIRKLMINRLKRKELEGDLQWARTSKAYILYQIDASDQRAKTRFDRELSRIKKIAEATNRHELKDFIASIEKPDS